MICDNCIHDGVCGLEGHLDEALTFCADKVTDVQPIRRGRWVAQLNGQVICSYCGKEQTFSSDFCKHCGADMRTE